MGAPEGNPYLFIYVFTYVPGSPPPSPQAPDHNLHLPQPPAEVNKFSYASLFHTWLVLFFTEQDPSTHQFVALATQNVMQMFLPHVKSEEHT